VALRAILIGTALLALLAGCGGGSEESVRISLRARLGPDGPHGQIAPVLTPVERDRRSAMSPAWQAVLDVQTGPSPDERAHGFLDTLDPQTRLRHLSVADGVATVDLAGREPDFYGTAALVYSLTAVDGVQTVQLRLDGRPCCAYDMRSHPVARLTRATYRGWLGEPCAERIRDDQVHCRSQ
jgi:sporulation and spore germination protein